ncbi:MAG: peptidoglycan-binding protein [bacterium]|nr:peptidoglycan-binding protein [bacterium]
MSKESNDSYFYTIALSIFGSFAALLLIFSMPGSAGAALNSSFGFGASGPQVTELQQTLTNLGYYSGPITSYFGPLTQAAVIKFQTANSIVPTSGYVGTLTRAKLNSGASVSGGVVLGASTPDTSPNPMTNIAPNPSGVPYNLPSTSNLSTATRVKNFAVSGIDISISFDPFNTEFLKLKDKSIANYVPILNAGLFLDARHKLNNLGDGLVKVATGDEGSGYFARALSQDKGYGRNEFVSIPWTLDWQDCTDQQQASDKLFMAILVARLVDKYDQINIVTHSHGTVIAYNALKRLEKYNPDIKINNFLSMGTIIGTLGIQSREDNECLSKEPFAKPTNVINFVNVYSSEDVLSRSVEIADVNTSLPFSLYSLSLDLVEHLKLEHSRYFQDQTLALPILQCTGAGKCSWQQNLSPDVVASPSSQTLGVSLSANPSSIPAGQSISLAPTPAPAPSVSAACSFTRDLYQGVIGSDVLCLQRYLNLSKFIIAASGPGSQGNETSYFGPLMAKAVSKWQVAHNISASGYVGAFMRAMLNIAVGTQESAVTTESTPTPSSPTPISSPPPTSAISPYNIPPPSGSSGGGGGSVGSNGGGGGGTISPPNTSVILNPLVFVSPSSGVAGTIFSEPGHGFTPNSTATLHFRKPDGTEYPTLNIQTDGSGNYENSWTSSQTSQTGTYTYWTIDATGLMSSTATFQITAAQQTSQTQMNTLVPTGSSGSGGGGGTSGLYTSGPQLVVPPPSPQTLSVSLSASPPSVTAGQSVSLTANVSGTAQGTINYTFYCNRSDSGTNITSGWNAKFDGVLDNSKTMVCNYPNPGTTYIAKVIAERGSAPPTEARSSITVATLSPVVNPMLLIWPASGPKGTKFTFVGTKFTPNGVIQEIITKPDGTRYTPNYLTANTDGNRDKFYDSSTASIFGTYNIYWIDQATGKQSNTVQEAISAY